MSTRSLPAGLPEPSTPLAGMEAAWKLAALVNGLDDTLPARRAFYAGGRHVLCATVAALGSEHATLGTAHNLNDGLTAFAMDILERETV